MKNYTNQVPNVNIQYGRTLDPIFIQYTKAQDKWIDWEPPNIEKVYDQVEVYKKAWKERGREILETIIDQMGLEFQRDVVDVYVVSGTPRNMANPIVMKSRYAPDEFMDVLTHELMHVLIKDNLDRMDRTIFKEMFHGENSCTRNHIVIHSVLKYLYLHVYKDPSKVERDIESAKGHFNDDYSRSWEIVEERGYKQVIKEFTRRLKVK